MAIPNDWFIRFHYGNSPAELMSVSDPRGCCPHCRNASTFAIKSQVFESDKEFTFVHLCLECNYGSCKKIVYVCTGTGRHGPVKSLVERFFMYPPRTIDPPHPSVPAHISDDWAEAQKSLAASAFKAAAVMLRRVLYDVLIDERCKLHPLHEGLKELIQSQRLPAIFDEWLPAIKDDGHDAAHPDRALQISTENVTETLEYTSEMLRFLYIEPWEFEQRKTRNAVPKTP